MKVTTSIQKTITVQEEDRYLSFTFNDKKEVIKFDSNLPYIKSLLDWNFYSGAIRLILLEIKKE